MKKKYECVWLAFSNTIVLSLFFFGSSCGPKGFLDGEYDKDVRATNLLDDRWSETDMQKVVKKLVNQMAQSWVLKKSGPPPVVMVTRLQNKTSEHIDTQSIMDMVRVEISQKASVRFVDKAARSDVAKEYKYQNSGVVSSKSKKFGGSQVGADLIINGRLDSIVQQVGRRKTVYYKITLNLTNLKTNIIEWTGQDQIRKRYRKPLINL